MDAPESWRTLAKQDTDCMARPMHLHNRADPIREVVTRYFISVVSLLALSAGTLACGEETCPEPVAEGAGWSEIAATTADDTCGGDVSGGVGGGGTGGVGAFEVQPQPSTPCARTESARSSCAAEVCFAR